MGQGSETQLHQEGHNLMVPHLGSLGAGSPDAGEELQDRHTLADVVQLPQMPALQDLLYLLSHPLPNPRDAAGFLEEKKGRVVMAAGKLAPLGAVCLAAVCCRRPGNGRSAPWLGHGLGNPLSGSRQDRDKQS